MIRQTAVTTPAAMAMLLASVVVGAGVKAQVTEVSRRPIADIAHLTFGSLCEDRFVIRNDGPTPVSLQYAVAKGTEHVPLTLAGREQVELESRSKEPLELWMDGRLVAKAEKEGRKCRDVQGNASVAIAPLEVPTSERDDRRNTRVGVGLGYGYPFYDPWFGPFGAYGWGYRPFYSGFYGVPIYIGGGRAGRRR